MTVHVADFDGAMARVRDAVVSETRSIRVDFETAVLNSSRMLSDGVGVLAHLERTSTEFAIVPLGVDVQTAIDPSEASLRVRTYTIRLVVAQWRYGKDAEDLFFDRLEAIENAWGALDVFTVDVDGAALLVTFDVAIATAEPILTATNTNHEVIGHTCSKDLTFAVRGCAT